MSQFVGFTAQWFREHEAREAARRRAPQEFTPTDDEGKLQDEIEHECYNRGWVVFRSRMDKPATGKVGTPDLIIATHVGVTLYIECKAKGRKATLAQRATLVWLRQNKQIAALVRSKEEFLKIAETFGIDETLKQVEALFL